MKPEPVQYRHRIIQYMKWVTHIHVHFMAVCHLITGGAAEADRPGSSQQAPSRPTAALESETGMPPDDLIIGAN